MKLIKTRPKIRLILPEWVHPGDRVIAEVLLDAKREVPVEFVRCTLQGWQRSTWGSGNTARTSRLSVVGLRAEPAGPQTLPEGKTRLRCSFDLPADAPPSYSGSRASIEYTIEVHAAVPWWPDARERFVLMVHPRPAQARGTGKSLHSTQPDGPVGDEPHIEFSLDETRIVPGDTIVGELALANVDHNRYRTARLSLVGRENVSSADGSVLGSTVPWRYAIEVDVESAREGDPIPFAMKLPDDLPPTFSAKVTALSWRFEIEVKIAWGKALTALVPVEVLPRASERSLPKSKNAAPVIGNPRIRAVWRDVANASALRFDEEASQLSGAVGDVNIAITREHRGTGGNFVKARLRYPSLHLSLDGGRATGLRRIFGRGVAIGHAGWDVEHYLAGREERQVRGFVAPLAPILQQLLLADISDEEMVVEVRHAGVARASLGRFVDTVKALAASMENARRSIPIPAKMHDASESWNALAKELGGPLEKARMAVSGRFEGAPAQVATEWSVDGEPLHTVIAIEIGEAIAEKAAFVWSEGRLLTGDLGELSQRARALVDQVTADALSLTVDPARIVLWAEAPIIDTDLALQTLARLAALAAALRGHMGPYR